MTEPARGGSESASPLQLLVDVRPNEVAAMWTSFVFFFFVLSSYFILRPIRDAVAVQTGVSRLPWLFAGTLIVMLIANPLFSSLVVRFPVRRFVPMTYLFFVANLLVFFFVMRSTASAQSLGPYWISVVFYFWASVYNLFITSVFWCLMADVFRSEQAKRLFGFIGVGGTLGAIGGSFITALLAKRLGVVNILLISASLLLIASLIVSRFPTFKNTPGSTTREADDDERPIGGSVWAGITSVMRSPYLVGIAGFQILYTIGSTLLYFELTDIVGRHFAGAAERTAILGWIEFAVQTLTVITQILLTGRLIRWFGLAVALALLPAMTLVGFTALGFAPLLVTVVVFTVLRRGTNLAITNPAAEVLFTVVKREDKYKAKSFIETFVYRAGDQLGAWSFNLFVWVLGAGAAAFGAVPFAAGWLALGIWLGRRQAQLAAAERRDEPLIGMPSQPDGALALNR